MSLAIGHLPGLFGTPGIVPTGNKKLLHQVASVHAELLTKALSNSPELQGQTASCLLQFLDGPSPISTKRRVLCHPHVIETLHTLSPYCAQLNHWHTCVTGDRRQQLADSTQAAGSVPAAVLGNLALPVLLGTDSTWRGEIPLSTDLLGRLSFPFSDWTISVSDRKEVILSHQAVHLQLDQRWASWHRPGDDDSFLLMPRDDLVRMIADNSELIDANQLQFPHQGVKAQLRCARKIGLSPVRYDPVAFLDYDAHAGLTGGIIQRILAAIQYNAPAIYREFCDFTHSIRGFEFHPSALGVVGSFSDPTIPGVMGFNISYSEDHEPRLDPFCFTWFGHEMGHSKNYLIDTVLYGEGIALVLNPSGRSEIIPRYGRAFSVRTLFQIPYVHLYEWALLMDFAEAGFRGLPWSVPPEFEAIGDDIGLEIEEAFAHIERYAQLSAWGQRALAYFHDLFDKAKMRWTALRQRAYTQHIVNS